MNAGGLLALAVGQPLVDDATLEIRKQNINRQPGDGQGDGCAGDFGTARSRLR